MQRATAITKPRILIVEDDRDVASILSLSLEDYFEIVIVPTSSAAKRELDERTPSLVILDWHLAQGSGREVLEAILTMNPFRYPQVIVTSGSVNDELLDLAVSERKAHLLPKPYQLCELIQTVTRLVH